MASTKYQPLYEFLTACQQETITLPLAEIERLVGDALPATARQQRGWWSNRRRAFQASAWMDAGYRTQAIDLEQGQVTFARPARRYEVRRAGDLVLWDADLIKALREHMGKSQAQFAEELGIRQQTVSEWENGVYTPSRANCKYLMLIAERAGFNYQA